MCWTLKLLIVGHSQRKKYEYCLVSLVSFPNGVPRSSPEFPGVSAVLRLFAREYGASANMARPRCVCPTSVTHPPVTHP